MLGLAHGLGEGGILDFRASRHSHGNPSPEWSSVQATLVREAAAPSSSVNQELEWYGPAEFVETQRSRMSLQEGKALKSLLKLQRVMGGRIHVGAMV